MAKHFPPQQKCPPQMLALLLLAGLGGGAGYAFDEALRVEEARAGFAAVIWSFSQTTLSSDGGGVAGALVVAVLVGVYLYRRRRSGPKRKLPVLTRGPSVVIGVNSARSGGGAGGAGPSPNPMAAKKARSAAAYSRGCAR